MCFVLKKVFLAKHKKNIKKRFVKVISIMKNIFGKPNIGNNYAISFN